MNQPIYTIAMATTPIDTASILSRRQFLDENVGVATLRVLSHERLALSLSSSEEDHRSARVIQNNSEFSSVVNHFITPVLFQ
jgi:hypothetical protein